MRWKPASARDARECPPRRQLTIKYRFKIIKYQLLTIDVLIKSAYLHIPFCRRRCFYCDFPITVLGDKGGNRYSNWQQEYVDFICQEIEITASYQTNNLETIFFGGGTPSLLAIEGLTKILETLSQCFTINKNAEISLEIDPATFDLDKLKTYQKLGINRVSLGVQSFQDNLLEKCGRTHTQKDIYQSVEWINQAGFDNWSLDLISGLPHQTITDWSESLIKAIELSPKHLSCYDLVLEPTTVFGKKYQAGDNPLPADETTAQMYKMASEKLTQAGYIHYEISNYAKKGYQCQHNQVYWYNQPYYAFGMGASSYYDNQRFTRPRTRQEYFVWLEKLRKQQGKLDVNNLTENDRLLETLMLGLRLKEGVNLADINIKFGQETSGEILKCLSDFIKQKLVNYNQNTQQLTLTDPEGFLYSNTVLTALFTQFDRP